MCLVLSISYTRDASRLDFIRVFSFDLNRRH